MSDLTFSTQIILLQTYEVIAVSDASYPNCTVEGSFDLI
jgi:hypothetical protein